jgi:hypothetical protein
MIKPGVYVSPDLAARAEQLGIAVTVRAELPPGRWLLVTEEEPKGGSPLRRWLRAEHARVTAGRLARQRAAELANPVDRYWLDLLGTTWHPALDPDAFRAKYWPRHQKPKTKGAPMHYKNGREAKNGDKVMLIPSYGSPRVGILYDATAGNDTCNGRLAECSPSDPMPNLAECLHLDDVLKALPATIPDSSVVVAPPAEPAPAPAPEPTPAAG